MRISILTLFPEVMEPYLNASILGRARAAGILEIQLYNIRDYSTDKHHRVDDYPFGGGAGMLMAPQPVFDCVEAARQEHCAAGKLIYLSPQGQKLDHKLARTLAEEEELILLCGHYEGMDHRVVEQLVDLEVSIGDYVLTGGELPALVLVDALSRFIPGVVGNGEVHDQESFENGLLEYPQYTRPADFRGHKVPEVLLNGNHKEIERWRQQNALRRTLSLRPDLLSDASSQEADPS